MRIIIIAVILAFTQSLHAQTVQTVAYAVTNTGLTRQLDIVVPAGEVFKLLTWSPAWNGPTYLLVDNVQAAITWPPTSTNCPPPVFSPHFVVAGPRTVSLSVSNNQSLVCSYILTSNAEVAGLAVPSSSVVIPADATGPVQITLESSTDLVTWTAATPGSYGSSTAKRFFRVKAVTQ